MAESERMTVGKGRAKCGGEGEERVVANRLQPFVFDDKREAPTCSNAR